MTDRFEPLHSGEVVSVQHDTQVLTGHRTFKVGELSDSIRSHLEAALSGWSEEKSGWFDQQGIECEALRFGSNGWQKGRIRLCLEFCPDESEAKVLSASICVSRSAGFPGTFPRLLALSAWKDRRCTANSSCSACKKNRGGISPRRMRRCVQTVRRNL